MRRPDLHRLHLSARRLARRAGSIGYRTIVVPLLEQEETVHALDLACRLAADRHARVVLVAPLFVERELPLDARFDGELRALRDRLRSAAAVAGSYGVGVRREIVRTRPGLLGDEVARVANERGAELVVVGAPVESRRGFKRAFPHETLLLLRAAPCRVMVATGPYAGGVTSGRLGESSALRPRENQAREGRREVAYPQVRGRLRTPPGAGLQPD